MDNNAFYKHTHPINNRLTVKKEFRDHVAIMSAEEQITVTRDLVKEIMNPHEDLHKTWEKVWRENWDRQTHQRESRS